MHNFLKNPKVAAKVHLSLAAIWAVLVVPTVVLWSESVLWIGLMSCYALFAAHLASYQAAASAGVDEATRLKLNAMADALAHFMENSDSRDDYLQPYVDELRRTVGIEEHEEDLEKGVDEESRKA